MNLLKLYRVLVLGGAVLSGASCGVSGEPGPAKDAAGVQADDGGAPDAAFVQDDGGVVSDAGGCGSKTFSECQAPCIPWSMQLCCG